jgi:hypothetical protein
MVDHTGDASEALSLSDLSDAVVLVAAERKNKTVSLNKSWLGRLIMSSNVWGANSATTNKQFFGARFALPSEDLKTQLYKIVDAHLESHSTPTASPSSSRHSSPSLCVVPASQSSSVSSSVSIQPTSIATINALAHLHQTKCKEYTALAQACLDKKQECDVLAQSLAILSFLVFPVLLDNNVFSGQGSL